MRVGVEAATALLLGIFLAATARALPFHTCETTSNADDFDEGIHLDEQLRGRISFIGRLKTLGHMVFDP